MSEPTEVDVPPYTLLDPGQVIKGAYDEARRRIRVDTEVSAFISGQQQVEIDHSEDSLQMYGQDGTSVHRAVLTDSSGHLDIVGTISSVQSGDWYTRILDSSGNSLSSLAGSLYVNITNTVPVSQSGTWNINNIAGTISLPTGAATSALQTTGNASLASIDSDIDVALSTRASEVTLSSLNSKVSNDYGSSAGAIRTAAQIGNSTGAANFGAGVTTAQTLRTVLVTDQTTIPISAVSLPLPTGAATEAKQDSQITLATTANSLLTTIRDNADAVEVSLSNIDNNTDGLETLITSSNSLLTQIRDYSDTIETLITTSNTQLTTINGNTDGLETLVSSTNSLLTTIRDNADNVETLLADIDSNTDGIETTLTSINTELDTANTNLINIQTEIDSSHYTTNEAFSKATAIAGQLDDTATTIATENNIAPVRITAQRALHTNLRDSSGNELLGTKVSLSSIPVVQAEDLAYSAAITNFVSAAAATDVFNIGGSGSKTIRINEIKVAGSTTSGSTIKVGIRCFKRSTANTGGTRVALTAVPHDSTSAAATATPGYYTANPTLGTSIGDVRTLHVGFTQSGLTGGEACFDFRSQPIILRGTSHQLCINFNGTTVTGALISIYVEWTEV